MWGFVWTRAILRDVVENAIVLSLPDHTPAPDDFKDKVEVSFEELDDAEAVELREPGFFLNPDLQCSAPSVGGAVMLDSEVNDVSVDLDEMVELRRGMV